VRLTIRYFDGCPNWQVARERLEEALRALGRDDQPVTLERVETEEDAERLAFRGSPTILIDGRDPFADRGAPVGLACRIYLSQGGYDGAPSVAQLCEAVSASN
jgi:hypothetical protein